MRIVSNVLLTDPITISCIFQISMSSPDQYEVRFSGESLGLVSLTSESIGLVQSYLLLPLAKRGYLDGDLIQAKLSKDSSSLRLSRESRRKSSFFIPSNHHQNFGYTGTLFSDI